MANRIGAGLVLAVLLLAAPLRAEETTMDAGRLAHALDRLTNTGRVLYVAAHPDDENTRLLAYLANARHVTPAYLSMTRGGGGQNLIGSEQAELLDVIRTEELLAARHLDGATQRFTRMRDFGYSKSAEETLALWHRDEALADVVWVIRTFQPDVVITRFTEEPPNHGHHTASAILAREAFAAAADPTRFPEQLAAGAEPWQADRLLHNWSHWGGGAPPDGSIAVDVGRYDPRLGLGYGELAARSRSQHKSQGFGVAGERGPILEHFVPVAGTRPAADILEGLELGWERFGAAAAPLRDALAEARGLLERDRPERALPALIRARTAVDALAGSPRVRHAQTALGEIIAAAAGLFVRATAARPGAVPGNTVPVTVEIALGRPTTVRLRRVVFPGLAAVEANDVLRANEKTDVTRDVPIPADAVVSAPYWLARPSLAGRQVVAETHLVGAPRGPAPLVIRVDVSFDDESFSREVRDTIIELETPVVFAWTDRVHGERVRRFSIAPPATVTPVRRAVMLPDGGTARVVLRVRAGADALDGSVVLMLPAGWELEPRRIPVQLAHAGDERVVHCTVRAPAGAPPADVEPAVEVGGRTWAYREDVIDYAHIPMQVVLQPASLRLVPLTLALPAGSIGYVAGSGDSVAEDMAHVGLDVEMLDDETLRGGDLDRLAAIVVGIRAYNTRDALRGAHQRLMEYVAGGGTVVVQYNTSSPRDPLAAPIGPYPIVLGRGRVTDETAALIPVTPDHPVLTTPNRIDDADFAGWVQERGLYFAETWDDRYQPIFRAADPGEEPLLGSLLVARHGRGRYVYTGLAFFRQLPAGVSGAYRLFANLVARAP